MTTAMMIIVLAVAALVVVLAVRFLLRKRSGVAVMPLTVKGLGVVGYDKTVMTRVEAERIARDLADIRQRVSARMEYIYGETKICMVTQLILDIHAEKRANWTGIVKRHMVVNPTMPWFRAHFAEEIHNLYRMLAFGIEHVYKPVDEADRVKREEAQEFCRGI
jgi:hypothetical protein